MEKEQDPHKIRQELTILLRLKTGGVPLVTLNGLNSIMTTHLSLIEAQRLIEALKKD